MIIKRTTLLFSSFFVLSSLHFCAHAQNENLPSQEICLVTVDDSSQQYVVVWEKTAGLQIKYYVIWRKDDAGAFVSVDTIYYADNSEYWDVGQRTDTLPPHYAITAVDSSGNASSLSAAHQPMCLEALIGTANQVRCSWNAYSGFNYTFFRAYEGSTQNPMTMTMDSMSKSLLWWEDFTLDMSSNMLYYMIEIVHPDGCTSTIGKTKNWNSARSNKTGIAPPPNPPDGLYEIKLENTAKLYPNPNSGHRVTISTTDLAAVPQVLVLFDPLGKVVVQKDVTGAGLMTEWDLPAGLAAGLYHVFLSTASGSYSLPLQIR